MTLELLLGNPRDEEGGLSPSRAQLGDHQYLLPSPSLLPYLLNGP